MNTVTNSQVLFHNGSLLHSMFNTQLLLTVHNSSRILTQLQLLPVLEHNCQITQPASTRPICLRFKTQLLITVSSSITHVRTLQVHSKTLPYIAHSISIVTSPFALFRYYGNATNSLSRNSNCHVTMETPQTHCHSTATVTLLWKHYQAPNMSQYLHTFTVHANDSSRNGLYRFVYVYHLYHLLGFTTSITCQSVSISNL
jgi:hypothetical protein